jgi:hypothetical protein
MGVSVPAAAVVFQLIRRLAADDFSSESTIQLKMVFPVKCKWWGFPSSTWNERGILSSTMLPLPKGSGGILIYGDRGSCD